MKIGILICTHNRYDYLKRCIDSILKSFIPENVSLLVVDDGSDDKSVLDFINSFCKENKCHSHFKRKSGIHHSLLLGFDALLNDGCEIFINIDSDAIVSKNWIKVLLELQSQHSDTIVSGFNTLSRDVETNEERHPVVREFSDHVLKKSIGGINMCFNKNIYLKYVRSSLETYWDWNLSYKFQIERKLFVVSKPSVVQHIGIDDATHKLNPDVSHDFDFRN